MEIKEDFTYTTKVKNKYSNFAKPRAANFFTGNNYTGCRFITIFCAFTTS